MYNDILTIGPITIHGYGLMIGIGVLAALLIGEARAKKRGLDGDVIYGMAFVTVFLGFLSAKILFIITEWQDFLKNPAQFLMGNGFVVFGGIIGGVLTIYGYCKIKKISFLDYADLMVPSVAVAQGFGRIGCFLAGCCYGRETDCFLGIVFTNSDFAPNGVRLIPTQLIMAAGNFVLAGILFWFAKKPRTKGKVASLYLILYSVGRFFVEFLRNDHRGSVGNLSTSQFIGIFIALAGAVFYIWAAPWLERRRENNGSKQS